MRLAQAVNCLNTSPTVTDYSDLRKHRSRTFVYAGDVKSLSPAAKRFGEFLGIVRETLPNADPRPRKDRRHLSQRQLANRLEKSLTYVANAESGLRPVTAAMLPAWADKLKVDAKDLRDLWLLMQGQVPRKDGSSVWFRSVPLPLELPEDPDGRLLDYSIGSHWEAEHRLAWAITFTAVAILERTDRYRGSLAASVTADDWRDEDDLLAGVPLGDDQLPWVNIDQPHLSGLMHHSVWSFSIGPDFFDPGGIAEPIQLATKFAQSAASVASHPEVQRLLWLKLNERTDQITTAVQARRGQPDSASLATLIGSLTDAERARVLGYVDRIIEERSTD
jgi:transcriptional regulator with XRE-family HTH domain